MACLARLMLFVIIAIVVASCGVGRKATTSSAVSPTQYANYQRDVGYLRAVNQLTAAFNKPPADPTDYEAGGRELQTAIHGLHSLSVPPKYASAHAHLISALRAIDALMPRFERAAHADDRAAQNNVEALNVSDQTAMNGAFRLMEQIYNRCKASKFAVC